MRTSKTSSNDNWGPLAGMPNGAEIRRPINENVLKKARRRGFKGISDFLRALAMRECHAAGA